MSIIRHEIRQISDGIAVSRSSPAVVHGNVTYFAGVTPDPMSAISESRLLKCCDTSMSFSTSRDPTIHSC